MHVSSCIISAGSIASVSSHTQHHQKWRCHCTVYENPTKCIDCVVPFGYEQRERRKYFNTWVLLSEAAKKWYFHIWSGFFLTLHNKTIIFGKKFLLFTQTEWMDKEHLATLLYGKYLITIPIIFDLFSAYGRSNLNILRHMVTTLFTIQPKYQSDLADSLRFLMSSFDTIRASIGESDPATFDDLAIYILDCGHTIHTLLRVASDSDDVHNICREIKLEQHVARFYDDDIPNLVKNVELIAPDSMSRKYLQYARYEFIQFFRCLIDRCLVDIMQST